MPKLAPKQKKRTRNANPKITKYQGILDQYAKSYADLLEDPCNARLVPAVMPGSGGGLIARFESYFNLGNGTDETACVMHWTPNALGNVAAAGAPRCLAIRSFTPANTNTAVVLNDSSASTPGYNFLRTNASNVRCIAACAQVFTNASEMNRSGYISFGPTQGGLIEITDAVTPTMVRNQLPATTRCPEDMIEIKWVPKPEDADYVDPITSVNERGSGAGSITIVGQGLSPASGILIKLTAVYEYQPSVNTGITASALTSVPTRNSFNDVLRYVERNGHWWMKVGSVAGSMMKRATPMLLGM